MSTASNPRKVIVRGRASFPDLVKGEVDAKTGKRKWGISVVLDPSNAEQMTKLKKAQLAALTEEFGEAKAKEMLKKKTIVLVGGKGSPIREDVTDSFPEGRNTRIAARTTRKPQVVSIFPDANGKPAIIAEADVEEAIYPGAEVNVSVEAYYFKNPENKGLTWSLGNVQKVADAERFDSRMNAQDEFSADESAAASLEDLENDGEANADEDTGIDDLLS